MTIRLSSLSLEYVKVPVSATESGQAVDPTDLGVEMAFTTNGNEPAAEDWRAGDWETAGSKYLARCLVGPAGAIELDDGAYVIWLRVTADPEIPVKRVGALVVT